LIGANGAGKSSTLKSIMGLAKASSGIIKFNDEDITNKQTTQMVSKGLILVPEGRRIFPNLTVEENLFLGSYLRKDKEQIKKDLNWVYELFPRLKERLWQKAGTLSGGEQQMLAVGRALMSKPKLLMMDEPSLGLAPLIVKDIFGIIKEIHRNGMTILLIEQNAKAALEVADYGYVLETGRITIEGPGKELLNNDQVQAAYLGEHK
jgi:branched-chain amino acid transport system ATP-binding protein